MRALLRRCQILCQTHRTQLRSLGILLGLGLGYYLLITLTPIRIPCVFHAVTGLACPGCGITRMCTRLAHLDFVGAAAENWALAILAPLWAAAILIRLIWHPRWLGRNAPVRRWLLYGSIGILVAFGVLRNLPGLEFLLPVDQR